MLADNFVICDPSDWMLTNETRTRSEKGEIWILRLNIYVFNISQLDIRLTESAHIYEYVH